ncbi:MAG: hypothetical protein MZV70_56585 [Desulfobacterales bacterium]|nr:hypothetical protein [Desulfobacterales bacterium]
MMPVHFFRKLVFLGMTIALLWGASAGFTAEKPNDPPVLRELDFDACEPVRYQAKITEVNHAKGTLTVAEKEIYLLDVSANEQTTLDRTCWTWMATLLHLRLLKKAPWF